MTLSMTNSEEIDGLNNRKFTGLFGLWQYAFKKQPNDKNEDIDNIDADYKEIIKIHSKIEQFYFWCLFQQLQKPLKKSGLHFLQ